MEDVSIQPTMRPTGQVMVDGRSQEANFYAQPTSDRPVEFAKAMFKQELGTVTCGPGDQRGKLLLTIDLDFNHGPQLASRKLNYAYGRYEEFKITGKRTDVIFGRSGALAIVYTNNPWYNVSLDDPAANVDGCVSDPTYRILAISDHLEIDIMKAIQAVTRNNSWFHLNPQDDMPRDYYRAGRVFIFVESPPQLLPFELPIYIAGSIEMKDHIPANLSHLTFARSAVRVEKGTALLTWGENNEWELQINTGAPLPTESVPTGNGTLILDAPIDWNIEVVDADDEDGTYIESHRVYDHPITYLAVEDHAIITLRTSISKTSNFVTPAVVDENFTTPLSGWLVFQDSSKYVPQLGTSIHKLPVRTQNTNVSRMRDAVGLNRMSALMQHVRGRRPQPIMRPAGQPDLLDLARAATQH
nr:Hypothetical protein CDS [Astacus astacus]